MTPTTVLIADDHLPTRGLLQLILEERDFDVVAEVGSGAEAMEQAILHRPDVCLLDVQMPGGDGLQALAGISVELPGTVCLMLSASDEDTDMLAALRGGAAGFLSKTMDLDRLPDAIRGVLRGEGAVPRTRMQRVLQELRVHAAAPPPEGRMRVDLTEEEWQAVQDLRARRSGRSGLSRA